eukprot:TRINITY_DN43346_c0_g1_i1.p1 TRINITY_DN43346_c0_g1~~TRINITY_DN43346_c0_g1_i1.p1  ORF type:complete len:376 (+),score=60.19 TRINITY_DN43346_c0_g1_i1:183-1310(+)
MLRNSASRQAGAAAARASASTKEVDNVVAPREKASKPLSREKVQLMEKVVAREAPAVERATTPFSLSSSLPRPSSSSGGYFSNTLPPEDDVEAPVDEPTRSRYQGVPESLRCWWERVNAQEFERESLRCGRSDVLNHIARRLRKCSQVVDLGCGPGLLAKESGRRDIVGVDICPGMIRAAANCMHVVTQESIFEFFPSDPFDAAVICNVLEPYPAALWRLVFRHTFDFLSPGGQLIVVIATQTLAAGSRPSTAQTVRPSQAVEEDGSVEKAEEVAVDGEPSIREKAETVQPQVKRASSSTCGFDLLLPPAALTTTTRSGLAADEVEDELTLIGFDVSSPELVVTNTVNHSSVIPGEEPPKERRVYAMITGRRPQT